jgi:NAD(P)-dependent dehydrogenase (short-subunit alcohol dehydrogenase family)
MSPSDHPDFPDGTALVIGGSGGVGRVICARLARAGADVVLTYRKGRAAALEAARAVEAEGRRADVVALSLDDAATVDAAVEAALGGRRLHTVVHAAGADIPMRFIGEVTPDEWRRTIESDVLGFFHVVRAALPRLRAGGGGAIVVLSSAGLERFPPRDILSVAPKAAIDALVVGIAREEGRRGIRANSVALGVIEAGIFLRLAGGELSEEWSAAALRNTALRRFGSAEEVAEVAVFLASSRASYVTGQRLAVDGGYSL